MRCTRRAGSLGSGLASGSKRATCWLQTEQYLGGVMLVILSFHDLREAGARPITQARSRAEDETRSRRRAPFPSHRPHAATGGALRRRL